MRLRNGTGRAARGICLGVAAACALAGCGDDGSASSDGAGGGGDGPVTGTGGSIARMTIVRDVLYALTGDADGAGEALQLFRITAPATPNAFARVVIPERGLETLFPYRPGGPDATDYLLVGAEAGVYIYDNSDPLSPVRIGTFEHARATDPVVARDGYAYVTLRGPGANTLSVVDVRDIAAPVLVRELPMQGPGGLSVGDGRLYVCDGRAGLKTFDITDPADPVFDNQQPDVDCADVIASGGRLHAITADALLQYDITGDEPVLLSRLGVDAGDEAAFARGPVTLR